MNYRPSRKTFPRRGFRIRSGNWIFLVFAAMALLAVTLAVVNFSVTRHYSACRVTDKSVQVTKDSSINRVMSTCGTFEVSDSILLLRFDSSDLYGSIEVGKTYDFDSRGIRLGIASMYPNITSAHAVVR